MNEELAVGDYFGRLGELLGGFDFVRPGQEGSLGKDVAGIIAQGIIDRSVRDQGGPTGPWPPNDPDYTAEKARKYGVSLIGFRTRQMISLPSLLGQVDVERDTVTIHYGTGTASEGDATDTEKAGYFTDKKGSFFETDDAIEQKVHEYVAEELDSFIEELNSL